MIPSELPSDRARSGHGDLLIIDVEVLAAVTNANNPIAYGAETYWGRKFIYRSLDGRIVVITV